MTMIIRRITLILNAIFCATLTKELIQNGGFEDGTNGWGSMGCHISVEQSDAFSGKSSLTVDKRTAAWGGPVQTLNLDMILGLQSGRLGYAIKLIRGDYFEYAWTMKVTRRDGSQDYTHLVDEIQSKGDGWKGHFEKAVTFPPFQDATLVELFLEGSPVDVDILLDDVSLTDDSSGDNWKDEANARIDQIRKRNLTISVGTDKKSEGMNPFSFKIELTQLSHLFPFGTALNGQRIRSCVENGVDDLYCSFARDNFNYIVLENAMKWSSVEPNRGQFRYDNADATLHWAAERGMRARGHCMFWAVPHSQTPHWVEDLTGAEMVEAVEEHVDNLLGHFEGMLEGWDVNNEMLHGSFFTDQSGDDSIRLKMFQWSHERSPELLLFVNDYNIITSSESAKYRQLIQSLLDQGAPVSAIGVQGHFGGEVINIDRVTDIINDLSQFNLPIWVTEFDWAGDNPDHEMHAIQLENFYRQMFSLEHIHGVLMWGFWDNSHWKPEAAIVNGDDLHPNAAGEAYMSLIHTEWNSGAILEQSGDLLFEKRVFQGKYLVRLMDDGVIVDEKEVDVVNDTHIVF